MICDDCTWGDCESCPLDEYPTNSEIDMLGVGDRGKRGRRTKITQEDFGTLCICALRYCHGRRTYMPSLVQEIVGKYLEEFSDKTIKVMADDCQFQRDMNLYGDECDKIDWLKWEQKVKDEQKRR